MADIAAIAVNLVCQEGIWQTENAQKVSFPDEAYDYCFEMENQSFWFKHRNNCIVSIVKRFHSGEFTLDLGGGNGFVSKGLQDAGIEAYMMEPGANGIKNARTRGVKNLIMSTLEAAGFRDSSIPSIGIFDVLEHIENDLGFLENIRNHLAPGGKLFITVPAFQSLWSRNDEYAGHFRRYSIPQLESLLSKAGFKIKYSSYFFSIMLPFIFLLRKLSGNKKDEKIAEETKNSLKMPGFLEPFFNCIWAIELFMMRRGLKIPAGSSIIVVAEKTT